MATFRKRGNSWQAIVRANGINASKSFKTRAAAMAWADQVEAGKLDVGVLTFKDLLEEYRDKVTVNKRGARSETLRLTRAMKDPIADIKLTDLSRKHFAAWRDRRLKQVSSLSVLREWATLAHAVKIARVEWEWLDSDPMEGLEKPAGTPPRDRLPVGDELERIYLAVQWDGSTVPSTVTSRVGAAVAFAIETGLRAQEICNLKWTDVSGRVATVKTAKTLAGVRKVPLSAEALKVLELLKRVDEPGESVFHLSTGQLDALFRKAKKKACVDGLRFHDLRAEACTRLAKKLNPLELARMLGHSDLSKLMIYFRETADDLADKL